MRAGIRDGPGNFPALASNLAPDDEHQVLTAFERSLRDDDGSLYTYEMETALGRIQACLDRWSLADLNVEVTKNNFWGQPTTISPAWVINRIMSHEAHHGSEIALILRVHGLPTLIAG